MFQHENWQRKDMLQLVNNLTLMNHSQTYHFLITSFLFLKASFSYENKSFTCKLNLFSWLSTRARFKADVRIIIIRFTWPHVISILDLDPCTDVTCEYHSHCIALAPHQHACVCEDSCPSYEEQVCASNGRTFDNLCLLQLEICLTRANYTAYHPGSCTGTWHTKVPKSMSQWKLFLKHISQSLKLTNTSV